MDAETRQKLDNLKAKIQGRLLAAEPEDFAEVRKKSLRYVHEAGWPEEEIAAVQVTIMQVEKERAEELGMKQKTHDRDRSSAWMEMFDQWDTVPESVRENCREAFTKARRATYG